MKDLRIVSPRQHGIIDYIYSLTLLAAPRLFGFRHQRLPATIARVFGAGALAMSLLTRYEFSVAKIIPLRIHLIADVISTVLLAASPFLFGFRRRRPHVWLPHVLIGLISLPIPFLTRGYAADVRQTSPDAALPTMPFEDVELSLR